MAITITSTNTPGKVFTSGETVTPTKLNSLGSPTTATTITLAQATLLGRSTASTGAAEEIPCTPFARTVLDDANAAAARVSFGLGTISVQDASTASLSMDVCHLNTETLTYGGTTNVDMSSAVKSSVTVSLTGNVTFTTSNKASGRTKHVRIICDGTARTFTFPAWVWIGNAPTTIAASKTAVLVLMCYGSADTDIVAQYGVQV
jgi:hypothetical protein